MATTAQRKRYEYKRTRVVEKLREKGEIACFGVRAPGSEPWNPSDKLIPTCKTPVFPLDSDQDFSDDVRADDLMFMTGADVDITACRIMLHQGVEYPIVKVAPFQIDGITIYNEVQVRG